MGSMLIYSRDFNDNPGPSTFYRVRDLQTGTRLAVYHAPVLESET